ncbi:MAG: FkbM family methyltransferase [Pseudomonadota bacterium]
MLKTGSPDSRSDSFTQEGKQAESAIRLGRANQEIQEFGTYSPPLLLRGIFGLAKNSFLKRGFFRHKINLVLKNFYQKPFDALFQNARFRLYPQTSNIDLGMLMNARYNMAEIDFLRRHIPTNGIFVDIGANIGLYSILLSPPYGPCGKVIAIEPNPSVLSRLYDNIALSQAENIVVVEAAVGAHDADTAFHSDSESLGGSRVVADGEIRVKLRTLQTILAEAGVNNVDGLKIDIEGFEDMALLPFFKSAAKNLWPRIVIIEQTRGRRWSSSVLDYLIAIGYEKADETRSNAMFVLKGQL